MKEFKIGDVVRTLKKEDYTGCPLFPVGTVGTIRDIVKEKTLSYKVEANDDYWWYSADMLELVETADMLELVETNDEIRKITLKEAEHISKIVRNVTSCSICPFNKNGCSAIKCTQDPQAILKGFNERYDDLIKVLKTLNEKLDNGEREYLTAVLKPYKRFENTLFIVKRERLLTNHKEYLVIKAVDENDSYDLDFLFPDFKKGTKYARLELNRKYTLKELGITL